METINNWILTDDASQQYVRSINNKDEFDLIEMGLCSRNPDKYEVYTDSIAIIEDYFETMREELQNILEGFGYGIKKEDGFIKDPIEDVFEKYVEDAYQIMAECIFEYYGSFQAEQIFVGSETDCIAFIQNYIKTH